MNLRDGAPEFDHRDSGTTEDQWSPALAAAESRLRIEPSHQLTPEKVYERRWVMTLLDDEIGRLLSILV